MTDVSRKQSFLTICKVKPERIFLMDALGALLTSFFLCCILAQLESYFGVPIQVIYVLSGIAGCLFVYSIIGYLFSKTRWKSFLIILIICNISHLVVSLAMIVLHSEKLTAPGYTYFILECIVIIIVVAIECKLLVSQK
ncbi:hypothetical protein GCM10022393_08200 [Aquimarina addita]|uniref:Uncharacterized protein n=1 Tax=Aquimarina addita TaxID=870485 RepID=A0ABP7XC78_9FLAO